MKVLVIDDEIRAAEPIVNGLKLREQLDGWQYYCPNKSNLTDINENLKHKLPFSPDVVILDLMMSAQAGGDATEPNGLKILESIKQGQEPNIEKECEVIVLSGVMDIEAVNTSHGRYIHKLLSKPADLIEVFEILKALAEEIN